MIDSILLWAEHGAILLIAAIATSISLKLRNVLRHKATQQLELKAERQESAKLRNRLLDQMTSKQADTALIQQKLDKAESALALLTVDNSKQIETIITKSAELTDLRKQLLQMKIELTATKACVDQLATSDRHFGSRIRELKGELTQAQVACAAALTEATLANKKILSLAQELSKSHAEYGSLQAALATKDESLKALEIEAQQLNANAQLPELLASLKEQVSHFEDTLELFAAGLYDIHFDFGTPDELKARLESLRQQMANLIRSDEAVSCTTKWTINGSKSEGTRATKHYKRIMLRSFNADADACLTKVRWNNIETMCERLRKSFEHVNDLGSTHSTSIQPEYLELKLKQLQLMNEYRESVQRAREAMRAAKSQAREEAKANREIQEARAQAELEEERYFLALQRAKHDLASLFGNERQAMLTRIGQLESSLAAASEQKQRAISMAQITKAGFVYIVSNIGSFGADVLKIGMTRRIDPHERIRELGGASVPFSFDVHAMIYSENAPDLESSFHRHFARQRINLANGRKEFFRATIDDVQLFAHALDYRLEFCRSVEAKDFRISSEIRNKVLPTLTDAQLDQAILSSKTATNATGEEEQEAEDEE